MKILYVNCLYHPHVLGGAEISLKLIVDGMKARGHEVAVLATGRGPGLQRDEVDGVPVYRVPIANTYWQYDTQGPPAWRRALWHLRDAYNRRMGEWVRDVARLERPDVASCHNLSGISVSAWDALADCGVPVVQVLHDHYLRCPRSVMFKAGAPCRSQCLSCKAFRLHHPRHSRRVAAVVGISRFMLEGVVADGYFAGSRQRVIYNARSIPQAMVSRPDPRPRLTFGFIGKLAHVKGIEWVLEAFHSLQLDADLLIAGQGIEAYVDGLRRRYASPHVSFVGHAAPAEFYPRIDVCLVPSLWPEALGMVAIEAAAFGVPVIASNRGGLPESIRDGVNGLICDPDDPPSLAAAMRRLAGDAALRERLAHDARASVAPFIDVDRMLDQYEELYAQLAPVSGK